MRPRSPAQHIRCLRRQPGGSQAQRAEAAVPGLTHSGVGAVLLVSDRFPHYWGVGGGVLVFGRAHSD